MGITSAAKIALSLASRDDSTTQQCPSRVFPPDYLDWNRNPRFSTDDHGRPSGPSQRDRHQDLEHQLAHNPDGQRHHQRWCTPQLPHRSRGLGCGAVWLTRSEWHGVGLGVGRRPPGALLWNGAAIKHHSRRALHVDHGRAHPTPAGIQFHVDDRPPSRAQPDGLGHRPPRS